MSPALVFFGRHPTPGRCKSRLARSVGSDDAAASIYDAIVRVVLLRATLSRVDRDETDEEQTRVIFTCAAEDDVAPCRALLERGGRWCVEDSAPSTSTAIDVRAQTQVDDLGARDIRRRCAWRARIYRHFRSSTLDERWSARETNGA